jgi:flagellar hook-length control protein FliK
VKNVPSVEPQTSAAGSVLNVNARNSRYSSTSSAERDSKQFSDLLDQTAPPENEGTPPSSRRTERTERTERTGRQDSREPARTRDSDPPASNAPAADQQPYEPSRAPSELVVAGPNKGEAVEIVPAKSEPAIEPEIAEEQGTAAPDAVAVAVAAVPVVPVAPPAAAVPVEAVAEQASEAAAVAAAASGDQPSKFLPTDTAAGDDKADDAAGAVPAEPAAAPTQKVDKPADSAGSAGQAAPATKPEARPGAQETAPAETGEADEPRSASREEPSTPQHEARTTKPTTGGAEAATKNVDAGPRHDQPAASHAGLEQLQTVGAGPLTATTAANAAAATPAAASQAPATAIPIASVAVEIAARAQAGNNRFEIRLDPPELGRIDVTLDVDRHGNVTSHLVVERSQTLDLLRRDAPQLERALNDAGLKTGDSAMQFSLRDQGANADRDPRPARLPPVSGIGAQAAEPAPVTSVRNYRWSGTVGGVDIRV